MKKIINDNSCVCGCRRAINESAPSVEAERAPRPKVGKLPQVCYAGKVFKQNRSTQNKDAPRGDLNE